MKELPKELQGKIVHGGDGIFAVVDTWKNNTTIKSGDFVTCVLYLLGNNTYQSNYSRLILRKME